MSLCELLIKASPAVIQILRENPICNLKTIQRRSKNIKDANPLSSMMAAMTSLYPISVSKERAIKCGMPSTVYAPDIRDTHTSGRRLCRLDAYDWYINDAVVEEDSRETIDILYKSKREEVTEYYNMQWGESGLIFGPVVMTRMKIATQKVIFRVPTNQRLDYLMSCLLPSHILDYNYLNEQILEEMKELRDLSMAAKVGINTQMRIILNMMDPKSRYVPCLKGYPDEMNRIRYVYASGNHIVRFNRPDEMIRVDNSEMFNLLGRAVWYVVEEGNTLDTIRKSVNSATYRGMRVHLLLQEHGSKEDVYAKYLRAVMDLEILQSIEIENVTFYPLSGEAHQTVVSNRAGVKYGLYTGREDVFFKTKTTIGQFQRIGDTIVRLKMQKTTSKEMRRIAVALGVFIKKNFSSSHAKTIYQMKSEALKAFVAEPGKVFNMGSDLWDKVEKCEDTQQVSFAIEMEEPTLIPEKVQVNGQIMTYKKGQSVKVQAPREYPMLPQQLRIDSEEFLPFCDPKKRMQYRLRKYLDPSIYSHLLHKIKSGEFNWKNKSIMDGVPEIWKQRVMSFSRMQLLNLNNETMDKYIVCFYYCFANGSDNTLIFTDKPPFFTWFHLYEVDLALNDGIFRLSSTGNLQIFGEPRSKIDAPLQRHLIPSIMPGYVIDEPNREAELTTIGLLAKKRDVPIGAQFNVSMAGYLYTLRREPSHAAGVIKTLYRQYRAKNNVDITSFITGNRKRRREEDEEDIQERTRIRFEEIGPEMSFIGDDIMEEIDLDDL